jgi:hypothetical protein
MNGRSHSSAGTSTRGVSAGGQARLYTIHLEGVGRVRYRGLGSEPLAAIKRESHSPRVVGPVRCTPTEEMVFLTFERAIVSPPADVVIDRADVSGLTRLSEAILAVSWPNRSDG